MNSAIDNLWPFKKLYDPIPSDDPIDSTPLITAAKNGLVGTVQLLLACGVDLKKSGRVIADGLKNTRK